MSRPVKNRRTSGSAPKGVTNTKAGKAKEFTGRERTGAGSFEEKGEAMFKGKSQILRDNRGA